MHLWVGPTSYREYYGTRQPWFWKDRVAGRLANPIGVNVVVETSDEKLLIGRRTGQVDVDAGCYDVIGGYLEGLGSWERANRSDNPKYDPIRDQAWQEMAGECPFVRGNPPLEYLGLTYDLVTPHPEVHLYARVCFSSEELLQIIERDLKQGWRFEEIEPLFWWSNEVLLRDFLRTNYRELSVTGEAALMLLGLRAYGQEWYERTLGELEMVPAEEGPDTVVMMAPERVRFGN